MSDQMTLDWSTPVARNADPATSHAAADALERTGARQSQKQRVLRAVELHPDLTSLELAKAARIDRYLCARRLPDLRDNGALVDNPGERTCRISGKKAMTWRLTLAGARQLREQPICPR